MTPFTQFLIVCVILFCIAVCVVDRVEVSRHNRLLADDVLQSWRDKYDATLIVEECFYEIQTQTAETEEDRIAAQNRLKIIRVLRAV